MLCAEGLVSLFKDATRKNNIRGFAVAKDGPRIFHIFFANDSLICCKVQRRDCLELLRILTVYKLASGQEVNLDKSGLMFNKNTIAVDKLMVNEVLGINRSMGNDSYLGLLLMFVRSKTKQLRSIKEKLWSRVQNWNDRLLSQAGRVVMIQSVRQTIPLYAISCFKLFKSFLHELNMIITP